MQPLLMTVTLSPRPSLPPRWLKLDPYITDATPPDHDEVVESASISYTAEAALSVMEAALSVAEVVVE